MSCVQYGFHFIGSLVVRVSVFEGNFSFRIVYSLDERDL